jgi:hypothetical protein
VRSYSVTGSIRLHRTPHFESHSPKAGNKCDLEQVKQVKRYALIALTLQRKHSVRTGLHSPVNLLRKVHAKKRKSRIWDWIDQTAYAILLSARADKFNI